MAATPTITSIQKLQKSFLVTGSIALTGNYATGGDTLNLASLSIPVETAGLPTFVQIGETPAAGGTASGYEFAYANGADLSSGKLQVFTSNGAAPAALAQLPAGAYNGALTGAKVNFLAIIPAL